jgi:hypothetical protein
MAKTNKNEGKRLLTGLFADAASADRAFRACKERGYEIGDVNVIMSEDTRKKLLEDDRRSRQELGKKEAEGGELGGPTGGRVGLLVTIGAAVGAAVAFPAIGIIAGPVAVALTAAGAAGVAGGLIAALGNWGIPADTAKGYESAVGKGQILMMVEPKSDADARAIESAWKEIGGRDVRYG